MRIRESKVKIQSPPSTSTTQTRSTITSHCSRCSHCHPRSGSSVSSSSGRSTAKSTETIPGSMLRPAAHSSQKRLASSSMPPSQFREALVPDHQPISCAQNQPIPVQRPVQMPMAMQMGMAMHEPRLHPFAPAPVLHNLGRGPEPLFGWESVMPLNHGYGQPKYIKRVKPDYRRFCFSVGKADVPFAAMPGGPLWGMDVTMAPQMVGGHRW